MVFLRQKAPHRRNLIPQCWVLEVKQKFISGDFIYLLPAIAILIRPCLKISPNRFSFPCYRHRNDDQTKILKKWKNPFFLMKNPDTIAI